MAAIIKETQRPWYLNEREDDQDEFSRMAFLIRKFTEIWNKSVGDRLAASFSICSMSYSIKVLSEIVDSMNHSRFSDTFTRSIQVFDDQIDSLSLRKDFFEGLYERVNLKHLRLMR